MRKIAPIIALTALVSCNISREHQTAQINPRDIPQKVEQLQPAINNQEPKERPNLIQIITHYNHIDNQMINETLAELHQTTSLDSIITDRFVDTTANQEVSEQYKATLPTQLQ